MGLLNQDRREYGVAYSAINAIKTSNLATGSEQLILNPGRGELTPTVDPSRNRPINGNHFCFINQDEIRIINSGNYVVALNSLFYTKFNPPNPSSFLIQLTIGSSAVVNLGYGNYNGSTYTNLENDFILNGYSYVDSSTLTVKSLLKTTNTSTFEYAGNLQYYSDYLLLEPDDKIKINLLYLGVTVPFELYMNGMIMVEKVS